LTDLSPAVTDRAEAANVIVAESSAVTGPALPAASMTLF
jgi:hypothetical protein